MVDTIIFDIGRVLVTFEWEEYLESFGFPQETNTAIGQAVFASRDWNDLDLGLYKDEEVLDKFIGNAPQYEKEIREVFQNFPSAIQIMPYAMDWVRGLLKKGFRVYYLSNYGASTREYTRSQLAFMDLMDGGLMSYEVHLTKPDPAFYQELFKRYQIIPEKAVFLDDNAANIEAAKALGLHTILFTDYASAVLELEKRFGIVHAECSMLHSM